MQELFAQAKKSLNTFFDHVSIDAAQELLEAMKHCSGTIVFSGVGKSGLIAQKIAATFVSTGTRARYLSCQDALHGDIGAVATHDLFVAISKSGESEELLALAAHVAKRGVLTAAIISKKGSRLEKKCNLSMFLPVDRELCPFDLAPTLSTAIQLLFGDILAVSLMKERGFSIRAFAENHPAGLLGQKIARKVADLMLQGDAIPLCRPNDTLGDVLHELSAKACGALLIADEQRALLGIFTDGDLRRAIQTKGPLALESSMRELMTEMPRCIRADQLAMDAMNQMEEDLVKPVTVLPVVEGKKVVGILRMHDILNQKVSYD